MKNAFSIFLLVLASRWHAGRGSCTDEDVSRCAQPLATFNLTSAPIVPTRTETEMADLCKAYDLVEQCLGGIEQDCDETQRLKMKTVDYQYDYICDKTFKEYLKHRECLASPDLHVDAMKCNVTLSDHYEEIKKSNRTKSYRRERLCQYVYQYISCIHVTVRGYCSEKAAEWQMGLDMVTVLPAFSSLNCPIFNQKAKSRSSPSTVASGGNETTMIIVAVIVVGIACLVLVGGMTAFFINRKRKADRKQAAHEMLNVTRRNPRSQSASRPSQNYDEENNAQEGAQGDTGLPSSDFFAPPPYLEKDIPPPSYRNPPNYDALFADHAGATGVSLAPDFPIEEKV